MCRVLAGRVNSTRVRSRFRIRAMPVPSPLRSARTGLDGIEKDMEHPGDVSSTFYKWSTGNVKRTAWTCSGHAGRAINELAVTRC